MNSSEPQPPAAANPEPPAPAPTDGVMSAPVNQDQLVAETYTNYEKFSQLRKPYEIQWYLNASALRGFPDVRFNVDTARLEMKKEPAHRKRHRINHIKPKYVARVAKYTRLPPNPTVVPATTDREDIYNAKATQKALEYYTRKGELRAMLLQAMQWVPITGKAFWAIRYNEKAIAHAPTQLDGQLAPIPGEVEVDFCSAFELLPADPGIELMANQPEILRVRLEPTKNIEERFNLPAGSIPPESADTPLFFYQRQIADLGARQAGVGSRQVNEDAKSSQTLLIERFIKPCAKYPHGAYIVCAGRKFLRFTDSLPGQFKNTCKNPYPFVEFTDDVAPGQFWPDAFVERLIGLQSEYNEYRSKLSENLAVHFFPKLLVWKQANLAPNAYTSEAGERLDMTWIPGMPPPSFLQPSSVVGDAWNILQHIRREMDDVTMIYPAALGGVGGANSGFQTNLLQEAADQVHGPSILRNSLALTEAYYKIRKLQKTFYTIPRLISIVGRSNIPEVYEYSADSIDEHADIRIEPDTMMPQLRSARVDQIRQLFGEGIFGNPQDPKTQKKALDMLHMAFADFEIERDARDSEQVQLENVAMRNGEELPKPKPWENHEVHYEGHIDLFKSPEAQQWDEAQLKVNVFHMLVHLCYLNPQDALVMAREFGLEDKIQIMLDTIMPPPPPPDPMAMPPEATPPIDPSIPPMV